MLAALLALVGQLAAGSLAPPDAAAEQQRAAIAGLAVLCEGQIPPPARPNSLPHRHHADPALLPSTAQFVLAATLPPLLLLSPLSLPQGAPGWYGRNQTRAPPRARALRPPTRGPPVRA